MFSKIFRLLTVIAVLSLTLAYAPSTSAEPAACDKRNNNTQAKLLECVTLEGVREHQAAFQVIADANEDTRAANTPGYDAQILQVMTQALLMSQKCSKMPAMKSHWNLSISSSFRPACSRLRLL